MTTFNAGASVAHTTFGEKFAIISQDGDDVLCRRRSKNGEYEEISFKAAELKLFVERPRPVGVSTSARTWR